MDAPSNFHSFTCTHLIIQLFISTLEYKYKRVKINNQNTDRSKLKADMGNAVGRSKKAKVMKIDGETMKWKTPARAKDVVKDYPGHVLLDSEAVKHFGLRAKPLEAQQGLKPKKLYFLVELPKVQAEQEKLPRRVRSSGIHGMNAKDRLDFLMLSKRSVSDLVKPSSNLGMDGPGPNNGPTRVKMMLPRAQLDKIMEESHDGAQVAEKILSLYMGNNAGEVGGGGTTESKAELGGNRAGHKPRGVCLIFICVTIFYYGIFEICVYFHVACLWEFSSFVGEFCCYLTLDKKQKKRTCFGEKYLTFLCSKSDDGV